MSHFSTSRDPQGMDISEAMLNVAQEREAEGDVCLSDMGQVGHSHNISMS